MNSDNNYYFINDKVIMHFYQVMNYDLVLNGDTYLNVIDKVSFIIDKNFINIIKNIFFYIAHN